MSYAMIYAITYGLLVLCIILIVKSWNATYKIAFYERLLERLRDEAGVNIGQSFDSVKNDFWKFIK